MRANLFKTFTGIVLLTMFGCMNFSGLYKTSIEVKNLSGARLTNVGVSSDTGFHFEFGMMSPGASKLFGGPIKGSPDAVFTVSWCVGNQPSVVKRVDVGELVKRRHKRTIVFIIEEHEQLRVETDRYW